VKDGKWDLIYLFLITIIIATGVNLTLPLVPLFLRDLGANVFQISLVVTLAGIVSTILTYVGGLFCDRYGRKRSIILGILLAGVSTFMYTFCESWEQTILWVILFDTSMSFFSPARMAYIGDIGREGSLGRVFGMMNLAWPIGGMIGPLIGGYLSDLYGWDIPFHFVALISLLGLLPAYLLRMVESDGTEREESEASEAIYWDDPSLKRTLFIFFAIQLLMGVGIRISRLLIPLYLSDVFRVSRTEIGLFFTISFGVTTMITQISASLFLDRYGSKKAMLHSTLLIPGAFILFPLLESYPLLILDYMLVNGLWSVNWPASMDLLMRSVPTDRKGFAAGIRQTGVRMGNALGPLVGAYLWESFGVSFSFYASALSFALCIPLILMIKET